LIEIKSLDGCDIDSSLCFERDIGSKLARQVLILEDDFIDLQDKQKLIVGESDG
jgi:hypothetical protein